MASPNAAPRKPLACKRVRTEPLSGQFGSSKACPGPAAHLPRRWQRLVGTIGNLRVPRYRRSPCLGSGGAQVLVAREEATWQFKDMPRSGSPPPQAMAEVGGHHWQFIFFSRRTLSPRIRSVSYTHLTLPTILRV